MLTPEAISGRFGVVAGGGGAGIVAVLDVVVDGSVVVVPVSAPDARPEKTDAEATPSAAQANSEAAPAAKSVLLTLAV
jgi:hypothetical protein